MANHHVNGDWEYNSYPDERLQNARLPPRRAEPTFTQEYGPRYGQQYYSPPHFVDPTYSEAIPRSIHEQPQQQQQRAHPAYSNFPAPQPHSGAGTSHSRGYTHVPRDDPRVRHQGSIGPAAPPYHTSQGYIEPVHRPSRRRESHSGSQLDSGVHPEQFDGQPGVGTRRQSRSSRHAGPDGHRGEPDAQLQGRTRPDHGPHQNRVSRRHGSRQHGNEEEIPGVDPLSARLRATHLTSEPSAPPTVPSQTITTITASSTDSELDPRYRVRADPRSFFKKGRVFSVLWHENAGTTANRTNATFIQGHLGEPVFGHIRRMVVAKEYNNCAWCFAIYTYGNRGLSKHATDASKHAIIYMEGSEPAAHPSEPEMLSIPLEVRPTSDDHKLSPMSRLNFGKLFTVEHNVKVLHIGKITERSMPFFLDYAGQEIRI